MTYLIVMVAGMSSRFGGKPKQMAKVGPNNMSLIEYSINQALSVDFTKIIFITNPKTEKLFIDIFGYKYKNIDVHYKQQEYSTYTRKRPWGTGDAIGMLYPYFLNNKFTDNFIMINGDDLYGDKTFIDGYNLLNKVNIDTCIIGGLKLLDTLPESGKVNRGVIFTKNNSVIGMKEILGIDKSNKELFNNIANVNFIGLQNKALEYIYNLNEDFKKINNKNTEIESLLPSHLNEIIVNNKIKMEYFVIKNKIYGITNPGDEVILKNIIASN